MNRSRQWTERQDILSTNEQRDDLLVPVCFGVLIQSWKHDWKNHCSIFCQETHDVFIVPVVESSFGNLSRDVRRMLNECSRVTIRHLLENADSKHIWPVVWKEEPWPFETPRAPSRQGFPPIHWETSPLWDYVFLANISINPWSPKDTWPSSNARSLVWLTGWVKLGSFSRNCTIQ